MFLEFFYFILCVNIFAQNDDNLEIFDDNQLIYTIVEVSEDKKISKYLILSDSIRFFYEHLINVFGPNNITKNGNIVWNDVYIKGIDKKLRITLIFAFKDKRNNLRDVMVYKLPPNFSKINILKLKFETEVKERREKYFINILNNQEDEEKVINYFKDLIKMQNILIEED